jgi:hypothetical protein
MAVIKPVWRYLSVAVPFAALALVLVVSAQGRASSPHLRLLDASPVRIAGSGFAAGERVRVRARAGGAKRTRHVRANAHGRFRVRFKHLAQDPCGESLSVTARGSDGHRASLKRLARMCPIPVDPAPGGGGQEPPPDQPCHQTGRPCPPAP